MVVDPHLKANRAGVDAAPHTHGSLDNQLVANAHDNPDGEHRHTSSPANPPERKLALGKEATNLMLRILLALMLDLLLNILIAMEANLLHCVTN
eukprot:CAMPEP_0115271614 /NCGR_PEP_ID=MMETSP0270-20121206/54194_1 /TAXON_ID=71861 /ORGANISM="Scrippsiella trochoidea, Strain CCMP3099" /LENGTH=93 /DNA_ID=CAMNT_0002687987 /DNA_START=1006 /DNA_END=1284 /DNA_ORIENTATION=-